MEPLYVGDVINYSDSMKGYDSWKLMEGVVMDIDRKSRVLRLNTGNVSTTIHTFKRICVYDEEKNVMLKQEGISKWAEGHHLIKYWSKEKYDENNGIYRYMSECISRKEKED